MSEFPGPTWIFLSSSVCSIELIHSKVHGKEEKGRETENKSEKANKNKRVSITCLVIKGIRRKFVLSVIHGKGRQALHPVIQDCVSRDSVSREGREGRGSEKEQQKCEEASRPRCAGERVKS